MSDLAEPIGATLRRGALSGLGGTVVMTAFQLALEMPATGRDESFAPAQLAERMLPWRPRKAARRRLNYAMHFALGAGWGVARGAVARRGLGGAPAIAATFGAMYPLDVATATLLGVYAPKSWTAKDTAIDVLDKLVQATVTGLLYDALAPSGPLPD